MDPFGLMALIRLRSHGLWESSGMCPELENIRKSSNSGLLFSLAFVLRGSAYLGKVAKHEIRALPILVAFELGVVPP